MISLSETVRISFRSLWANKMRSALTMLGIVIGVAAVIAMLAIGTGASRKLEKEVNSVGSNLMIVMPGSRTQGGMRMGSGTQSTLTRKDAEAIVSECSAVAAVAPVMRDGCQVVYGNQNWATSVQGTTAEILTVNDSVLHLRFADANAGAGVGRGKQHRGTKPKTAGANSSNPDWHGVSAQ